MNSTSLTDITKHQKKIETMKTTKKIVGLIILMLLTFNTSSYAHCEIPCGIYQDSLRIELIKEHITTIKKSMVKIEELSREKTINYNQLVRWINNKEEHATKIQTIVSQYFLTQRVKKPTDIQSNLEKYITQLTQLHQALVYAMKCKQTTNTAYADKLQKSIDSFAEHYFHIHDTHHHH